MSGSDKENVLPASNDTPDIHRSIEIRPPDTPIALIEKYSPPLKRLDSR